MQQPNKMQTIKEVIHKKKEAKKKQQVTGQLPARQLDNWTTGKNTPTNDISQSELLTEVAGQQDNRTVSVSRLKRQLHNSEIDEFLFCLIKEGIANPAFSDWYAKCIHTLGLNEVNRLVINSRNGKQPSRLLSFKLKGAMQLHYKLNFEALSNPQDKQHEAMTGDDDN